MKRLIEERAIEIAHYIIDKKCTIRQVARVFAVSKSTAHRDIHFILPGVNPVLASQVHNILDENFKDKHNRGGKATKIKYGVSST